MTHDTPLLRGRDQSMIRQGAMILAGTMLIAVSARVSVPMWPVPMTLQGLAILVVGLSLGPRLGALALITYLAEGAMGLPVFAGGGAGLAYMAGPTGGFLLGFVGMAAIAGLAARSSLPTMIAACLAGALFIYIPGLAWPYAVASGFGIDAGWASSEASSLWTGWMQPFLIGDAIKSVLAAVLVTMGFRATGR